MKTRQLNDSWARRPWVRREGGSWSVVGQSVCTPLRAHWRRLRCSLQYWLFCAGLPPYTTLLTKVE